MPQGDKSSYIDKQKRKAEHIEEGYENKGVGMRRPNVERGLRRTRNPAGATNPDRGAAKRTATKVHGKGARRVARARAMRSGQKQQKKVGKHGVRMAMPEI